MENRLYRSTTDKMLGGVCAGLGKYLRVDITIVRLFFVVLTLVGGFGPVLYIILGIVVPPEGHSTPSNFDGEEFKERAGMQKVSRVRIELILESNRNGQIIGLHAVLRQDDTALHLMGIGIQTQISSHLINTQVCTVSHHNEGIHFRMLCNPGR